MVSVSVSGTRVIVGTGQTITSLYHASEALRLGSTLFSLTSPDRAAAATDLAQPSALPLSTSDPTLGFREPTEQPQPQDTAQDPMVGAETADPAEGPVVAETCAAQNIAGSSAVGVVVGLEGVGYWQVTWLYLTSLLKLGEVYEVAGSHEDAIHAFREGQELVSTVSNHHFHVQAQVLHICSNVVSCSVCKHSPHASAYKGIIFGFHCMRQTQQSASCAQS